MLYWLPQGTILVNSCNSGDKCNCQNNKCFFCSVHSVIKVTNKFLQWQGYLVRANFNCCCMGCIAHRWLPQGTNLASSLKPCHSCNSGDKCNCQNNKSFFAVNCESLGMRTLYQNCTTDVIQICQTAGMYTYLTSCKSNDTEDQYHQECTAIPPDVGAGKQLGCSHHKCKMHLHVHCACAIGTRLNLDLLCVTQKGIVLKLHRTTASQNCHSCQFANVLCVKQLNNC